MRVTVSRKLIVEAEPCTQLDLDVESFGPATEVNGDAITFEFEELLARKPVAAGFLVKHRLVEVGFAEWRRMVKAAGLDTAQLKADTDRYREAIAAERAARS